MFFKNEEEGSESEASERSVLPLLPLRDIIVFPNMISQLFVGRERSIAALEEAMSRDKEIFLAAQRHAKTNEPTAEDIFSVGTIGFHDAFRRHALFDQPFVNVLQHVGAVRAQSNDECFVPVAQALEVP